MCSVTRCRSGAPSGEPCGARPDTTTVSVSRRATSTKNSFLAASAADWPPPSELVSESASLSTSEAASENLSAASASAPSDAASPSELTASAKASASSSLAASSIRCSSPSSCTARAPAAGSTSAVAVARRRAAACRRLRTARSWISHEALVSASSPRSSVARLLEAARLGCTPCGSTASTPTSPAAARWGTGATSHPCRSDTNATLVFAGVSRDSSRYRNSPARTPQRRAHTSRPGVLPLRVSTQIGASCCAFAQAAASRVQSGDSTRSARMKPWPVWGEMAALKALTLTVSFSAGRPGPGEALRVSCASKPVGESRRDDGWLPALEFRRSQVQLGSTSVALTSRRLMAKHSVPRGDPAGDATLASCRNPKSSSMLVPRGDGSRILGAATASRRSIFSVRPCMAFRPSSALAAAAAAASDTVSVTVCASAPVSSPGGFAKKVVRRRTAAKSAVTYAGAPATVTTVSACPSSGAFSYVSSAAGGASEAATASS